MPWKVRQKKKENLVINSTVAEQKEKKNI